MRCCGIPCFNALSTQWCAQTLTLLGDKPGAQSCVESALKQGIPQQRIDALLSLQRYALVGSGVRKE